MHISNIEYNDCINFNSGQEYYTIELCFVTVYACVCVCVCVYGEFIEPNDQCIGL